jgi:6-phosphogluconate dehydrogenase
MQMICEAYFLLRNLLGLETARLADIFAGWNEGDLDSYLVAITADILKQPDPENPDQPLVDAVLDAAEQKGTGKWTSINALELGVPGPTIAEAVFARCLSALKEQRVQAAGILPGPKYDFQGKENLIEAVRDALYCSKVCSYAQGFAQMAGAREEYGWDLDLADIAQIWRGGCIIRARLLQRFADAYRQAPELDNLLLDPAIRDQINQRQHAWRKVVALAAEAGLPCPAFSSALAYYDGYRMATLPMGLLQAQRDHFGAHTYERVDKPRGQMFHLDWLDPNRPQQEA